MLLILALTQAHGIREGKSHTYTQHVTVDSLPKKMGLYSFKVKPSACKAQSHNLRRSATEAQLGFDCEHEFEFGVEFEFSLVFEFEVGFAFKVGFGLECEFEFGFKLEFKFKLGFEFELEYEFDFEFELELKFSFRSKMRSEMVSKRGPQWSPEMDRK